MLEIVRVPVLKDNYSWLVRAEDGAVAVVDPGEAAPVLDAAQARGWTIGQAWITHWHPDHTGGVAAVKAATGATVTGPEAERAKIDPLDRGVREGDSLTLGQHRATVLEVPGHTAGHIAFHLADDGVIFTGDTLFALGCGRLFEGDASQMYANMRRLAALPDSTAVYCGHEYTQSNGRFALTVEPDNAALVARMAEVDRARGAGEATVPTTIAAERATNPFLRAPDAATFARWRAAKDSF
ncbi:hydroxyacylglutathione hydrolase [Sphingomonas sp. RRHST34]|jgi:hydroxyacylglutathione hydrolase|uniref:Hydroxyacylglutathione hydrolase n=1 Tax=Sphingomonas citri TaxID=2862499 RepID=A0ABS7BQ26_9SPHN|nr:hydroxyacylglutathione hydrolase [Sphingomonas citri]MBW6531620.1 hydroxyacylglutathione hydrolase [Sphingomonas citri]